ncbi:MAG TPA: RNA methyltransferase substrate-binding domain-containing protein, partial [Bacteroidales bacterium]|nr:RNA methyltransferase substrate-binding domain-containing protein [Bacteroidales bacterium]
MLSKNTIKYINSLKISKFRNEHRAFIVEGTKSVSELLQSSTEVLALFATETWIAQNPIPATALHVVTDSEMNRISSLSSPPGILAVAKIPDFQQQHYTSKGNFGLVLDGINDPG